MLSNVLQPKIVLYICFTYIVPKPVAKFLYVLLLNNIIRYMKREIGLDLYYVYTVDKHVRVKLEYCTRMSMVYNKCANYIIDYIFFNMHHVKIITQHMILPIRQDEKYTSLLPHN